MMLRRQSWAALHRLHSVGRYLPALLLVVLAVADVLTLTLVHPWGAAGALVMQFAPNDMGWGVAGVHFTAILPLFFERALQPQEQQCLPLPVRPVYFFLLSRAL